MRGASFAPVAVLTPEDFGELAAAWAVLGDPIRLMIISFIVSSGEQNITQSELVARLPVSQPTVSHHIRLLRRAGFVAYRSVGTTKLLRVDTEALGALAKTLPRTKASRQRRAA